MFRLIVRYLFLAILATAAVAVLLFWRADDRAPLWAARDACQVSPTPQCLVDLAGAQLLARDSLPDYLPEIGYLARLGRFELARAVAAHWVGVTENSKADVVTVLAPHVFAAAVRDGAGFKSAWKQAGGGTDTRLLYIAALDLLGTSPYGVAFASRRPVKPAYRDVVRQMARTLVQEAGNQNARRHQSYIAYAAHLYALLDDRGAVLRVIDMLGTQGVTLHLQVFAVGGTRRVVQVLEGKALMSWPNARNAGRSTTGVLQDQLFQRAFMLLRDREPAPKFSDMANLVVELAGTGHRDMARQLAYQMPGLAREKPGPLPIFAPIDAAKALSAAGGDPEDVRGMLDLADGWRPFRDDKVVGIGIISGPILWQDSGLADEADQTSARIEAELGDLGSIRTRMGGMKDPVPAWGQVLHPRLSDARISQVLAIVDQTLEPDEQRLIRAGLAVEMVVQDADARALALARPLVENASDVGAKSYQLWAKLSLVALATGDTSLLDTVMMNRARAALAKGSARAMLLSALSMAKPQDAGQIMPE